MGLARRNKRKQLQINQSTLDKIIKDDDYEDIRDKFAEHNSEAYKKFLEQKNENTSKG